MGGYKVLVVEDSPTMMQLLLFIIKKLKGVEVATSNDGVNALKKLAEARYDLVLTDINMPLMDGLKFINITRNDKANLNKDVPIIVITTEGEEEVRDKGIALGANSYITKPVKPQDVIDAVRLYLKV